MLFTIDFNNIIIIICIKSDILQNSTSYDQIVDCKCVRYAHRYTQWALALVCHKIT